MLPAGMYSSAWATELASAAPFLALSGVVLALLGLLFIIVVNRRLEKLSLGKNGSIEESIQILTRNMREMQAFRGDLEQYLKVAESRLVTATRGVGVVRFNAFANNAGGNQSFAIAFLDEGHSGVVFSALYARDRVGVYAKPIEAGKSSFTLSEEEQQAVDKAVGLLSIKRARAK